MRRAAAGRHPHNREIDFQSGWPADSMSAADEIRTSARPAGSSPIKLHQLVHHAEGGDVSSWQEAEAGRDRKFQRANARDRRWSAPITGIAGCCARAASGHAAAAQPSSVMNSRRFTRSPRRRGRAASVEFPKPSAFAVLRFDHQLEARQVRRLLSPSGCPVSRRSRPG
jgi:hypothetical protein